MFELLDDTCTCGHEEREHAIEAPSPCRALWFGEPCQCQRYTCAEAELVYGGDLD